METRKLQKTGGSTYIVSLPKQWVTSSRLKEGDSVSMTIDNRGLLTLDPMLGTLKPMTTVEVYVEDEDDSDHFLRRLIGLYISGHDEIVIRSKTRIPSDIRKVVRDFTRRVIGPEIVEESGNAISVQDVADHSNLDMRKILRRMHLMSRSMQADAMEALTQDNKELAADVVARDDEVDRLYWFMSKQLSMIVRDSSMAKKMDVGIAQATFYLSASKALERIADHAERIAQNVQSISVDKVAEKVMSEMKGYGSSVLSVLDKSVESLLRLDIKVANEVIDESDRLRVSGEELTSRTMEQRGRSVVPLALIVESLVRTALYSADIAEIAINLEGVQRPS
jgi:phosphate uptake regulator